MERPPTWRLTRCFLLCLAACGGLFAWFLTYGSFRFVEEEALGVFFDYQARSLLEGRLDVPAAAIGNEAFVHEGRTYGYFGLTPALLRLPLVLAGLGFGQVTRLFMLGYFVVGFAALFDLTRQGSKLAAGAGSEPPAWLLGCLLVSFGSGSTVLMLGSRSFVYHEAILSGIAFALAGCALSLRWLRCRHSVAWAGAVFLGLLAVHARPPCGLFALGFTALVAAVHWWSPAVRPVGSSSPPAGPGPRPAGRFLPSAVALSSVLSVMSFNAVSYLKFGTWEGCPLRYNVQYTPDRLAVVGHGQFHLVNIPHNVDAYFTGLNFRLKGAFPFFETLDPARAVAKGAFVEPGKPISVPFSMPSLSLFAVAGLIGGVLLSAGSRLALVLCWLALLPMALALCAAVVVTQRYTGDFIPFLMVGSAVGMSAVASRGRARKLVAGLSCAATVVSVVTGFLIAFHYQGTRRWGVPQEVPARYEAVRQRVDRLISGW